MSGVNGVNTNTNNKMSETRAIATDALRDRLIAAAVEARDRAYAPYSGFRVGAALKARGLDELVVGCNVENASYGATICAERTALTALVAQHGRREVEAMALVTDCEPPAAPCGLCLQVLSELAGPSTVLYLANVQGTRETVTLDDLMPRRFDRERLQASGCGMNKTT